MAKQLMPKAELEPRESDIKLTEEQFLKISLFAQLKKKPSLDRFPGTLVVRRYRKGEVIFRQGEAGWTAFYVLTSEDLLALVQNEAQAERDETRKRSLLQRAAMLEERVAHLKAAEQDDEHRKAATINLVIAGPSEQPEEGWLGRLRRRWLGPDRGEEQAPQFIHIDGPRDIDANTLQAPLYEGDLFGENSCMFRTPRSGTVVATRNCYMLEMLRNILDQLQKDPSYKAQMDEIYRKRVFQLHLRELSIFRELTEAQFAEVRDHIELVTCEAGQLICDEYERADALYLIRSGLVKVIKKVSALLGAEHVRSWPGLWAGLREGEQQPNSAHGKVWQLLPEKARALVRANPDPTKLPEAERVEILYALNDVIKNPQLPEAPELRVIVNNAAFRDRIADLPAKQKDRSPQDQRRVNRYILEALYDKAIRSHRRRVGPDCVLSYCTRGEFIGEIGLVKRHPREATCLAYGHPQDEGQTKEAGRVELVRIPGAVLERILELAPSVRRKLERKIAERLKQTQQRINVPIWDESSQVLLSERFEKLGLLQGQRLMLIDLDRCTRCDECVRACAHTHGDGKSRLFLDGPRFGKYLVPTTCRSCLDPVCMIGCPVGSIHRGNNGQIVIEDWCIGCGLCASQCPYGAIQMHDIGIIRERALGWRYLPAAAVTDAKWFLPGARDRRWALGDAPFFYNREFHDLLAQQMKEKAPSAAGSAVRAVYFRYEFRLASYLLRPDSQFKMEITSVDPALTVWVNGHEVSTEKARAGKRDYWIPGKKPAGDTGLAPKATDVLRVGRNVVAVKVTPQLKSGDPRKEEVFFDLRLDEVRRPSVATDQEEDVIQKVVTERAVVCDLCSSSWGQVPACVNACPHDAAMRVDARSEFPVK
jgi:Fe-S-cluster-containing hydrogenase component 2